MLSAFAVLAACVAANDPSQPLGKPDLKQAARINTQLGVGYLREGQISVALDKLKLAVKQDPDYAEAHSALAVVSAQRGDYPMAESEYRRALSLDSSNPDLKNNFGAFLCERGKYDEGQRYLLQAAENRDYRTPEAAWTNAGVCAQTAGEAPTAEKDFRQALQINPSFPDALSQMTRISFDRQDYLRAQAFADRYRKVGRPTAQMLWLSSQIERKLGNGEAANDFAAQLIQQFPASAEAAQASKLVTP